MSLEFLIFFFSHQQFLFESIEALEIKTSILFCLDFFRNTILSCSFFFFLVINLYFLISAVITQTFNPTTELLITTRIPIKEATVEMKAHRVTVETKIGNCSRQFKTPQIFLWFFLINSFCFF